MRLVILCAFLCVELAQAQEKYPVSGIPENMKTGMYAVVRRQDTRFEIVSINQSVETVHSVITILNENGKMYAKEVLGYDKVTKITSFKGTSYDADGNAIKKLKQSEIYDQSSISGFSIYEDSRLKRADLSQTTYPFTVEFEYEIERKYLYSIPPFFLYTDDEVSIQKASYSVVYPKNLTPRFKLSNIGAGSKGTESSGKESVTWNFENVVPSKFEAYSPDLSKVVPNILAGPVQFEYDGYPGMMDTWENLGRWQSTLNQGRDVLPEAAIQRTKTLTKDAKTIEEKTRILYEYLQNNTRYVSIQRGIGGFQPMESKTVEEMKYGDCKALSNYMVSMLKEVGVKAYYTQINAGERERPVPRDFTIDYFNHIVVAVPNQKDTIWLECTSQTKPFGFMGSFTGDRYALMVTENGGKLVRTTSYSMQQNQQVRTAEITIGPNGDGTAKVSTRYTGLQYENDDLNFVIHASQDDQKKWIQKTTQIPVFEVSSFSMLEKKDRIPVATVNTDYTLKKYATVSGKRLFLVPNIMNRSTTSFGKAEKRNTPVVRRLAYIDVDSIRFNVPAELHPEFLPPPVKIESRFGQYEASMIVEQGKLIYVRRVKMHKGEFPPESFNELSDFYKNITKADNAKVVFLSKT